MQVLAGDEAKELKKKLQKRLGLFTKKTPTMVVNAARRGLKGADN